jgi:predicted polyphosphate/ATP-dependent NAD kinase
MSPLRVGLIVNPVAGVGGPGGFKGSDGQWQAALAQGYEPTAPARAARFVAEVARHGATVAWLTVPGVMGVAGLPTIDWQGGIELGATGASDTRAATLAMRSRVDLLCFVGGDGTATDVAKALATALATALPCLGIPAGVKITSPVFCHDVEEAAWLVAHLAPGFETIDRDVTDVDEEAYRAGRLQVTLTGSLRVPRHPALQGGKVATSSDTPMGPLVEMVMANWAPDAIHILGAGSVMRAIKSQFWGEPTLLGFDAINDDRIVARDLDDRRLAAILDDAEARGQQVRLLLSPIGGQGMLLGRGTQVLRPDLLRRIGWQRVQVVAPPEKLLGLRCLWIDSGDAELDAAAPRHIRVITGWNETRMMRLLHGPDAPQP